MSKISSAWFLRNACLSALAGAAGSVVVKTYRRDKKRGKQMLRYAALAGVAGLTIGYAVGYVRHSNMYIQAVTLGTNFFLVSGTFLVTRECVMTRNSIQEVDTTNSRHDRVRLPVQLTAHIGSSLIFASAVGGATSGFLITLFPWRGFLVAVLNSIQGLGLGVAGQYGYDKARIWRLEKAIKYRYPDLFANNIEELNSELEKRVDWQTWLAEILTSKSYSGRLDEKIRSLEIQLEILEDEETGLIQQLEQKDKKRS